MLNIIAGAKNSVSDSDVIIEINYEDLVARTLIMIRAMSARRNVRNGHL